MDKMSKFTEEIARIQEELYLEYERDGSGDLRGWTIKKIMEIIECSEEEANKILDEMVEGIERYKEIKEKDLSLAELTNNKVSDEVLKESEEEIDEISEEIVMEYKYGNKQGE